MRPRSIARADLLGDESHAMADGAMAAGPRRGGPRCVRPHAPDLSPGRSRTGRRRRRHVSLDDGEEAVGGAGADDRACVQPRAIPLVATAGGTGTLVRAASDGSGLSPRARRLPTA